MVARTPRKGTSTYKIRNWAEYNKALRNQGSITFIISEDAISNWNIDPESIINKKQGRQKLYSDYAIEACLALRCTFNLQLRQTQGFMDSLLKLMNLTIISPDYTTLSRRTGGLSFSKDALTTDEDITILIDSTGLKICGSGEWEIEKHGKGRKKKWLKLHIAVNAKTRRCCINSHNLENMI